MNDLRTSGEWLSPYFGLIMIVVLVRGFVWLVFRAFESSLSKGSNFSEISYSYCIFPVDLCLYFRYVINVLSSMVISVANPASLRRTADVLNCLLAALYWRG